MPIVYFIRDRFAMYRSITILEGSWHERFDIVLREMRYRPTTIENPRMPITVQFIFILLIFEKKDNTNNSPVALSIYMNLKCLSRRNNYRVILTENWKNQICEQPHRFFEIHIHDLVVVKILFFHLHHGIRETKF